MNNFITKMMCMALMMVLCLGGLSAQTGSLKGDPSKNGQVMQLSETTFQPSLGILGYQDAAVGDEKYVARTQTRAELELGYCDGTVNTYYGTSLAVGTSYISGCVDFTSEMMSNYVGCSLHTIEATISPSTSGTTNLMGDLVSYKVWIKTSLTGAVVYEEDVTSQVVPGATAVAKSFVLGTPYTITSGPLVIGVTAGFTMTATGSRYPLPTETANAPYPSNAYNFLMSTSATGHGAGAAFSKAPGRALHIWGHVTGNFVHTNNLCAAGIGQTLPLKILGSPAPFIVIVFNAGTASQNNYSVQLVDATNNVVATQAVTTAIASGAYAKITVNYTPTTGGEKQLRGRVVLTSDQNSVDNTTIDVAKEYIYPITPMAYIDNSPVSGASYGAAIQHQGAIGYTTTNITPFAGKKLTAIRIGFSVPASTLSNCKVWIASSLTTVITPIYEQTFTPTEDGWVTVNLNTPYIIPSTTTYIGWTATSSVAGVMGYVTYSPQVADGGRIQGGTNAWTTLSAALGTGINNALIGVVENATADVTISTAVYPSGAGSVTGGGTVAVGASVTLTATANSGYTFQNWTVGGSPVSTQNPYTFNASVNATYTANFQTTSSVTCTPVTCSTTNTSYTYDPLPGYYGWNRDIALYEASELGGAGNIIELAFNIQSANTSLRPMSIYLMHTTATTVNDQYVWNTMKASATLVYDGQTSFPATGWQTFSITPFAYDGTQNLFILVEGTGCTTGGGCSAQCYYVTKTNSHWRSRTDTNPPNDAGLAGERNNYRANVRFLVCDGIPTCDNPASNLQVNYQNSCAQAVLTWNAPVSGPHVYNVYRDGNKIAPNITVETFTDLTFDQYIGHTWEVKVVCDYGIESTGITATKTKCNESTCAPKTIGTGTSGDYDPLPGYYAWNRDIMLYEASELGGAGAIMDISYNISSTNTNTSTNRTMKIYLMTTTETTLQTQYVWNTMKAQATLVYEATPGINFPTTGWQTFTLSTPFFYNGTENLLILVEGTGCTTSGGCSAQCYYTTKTNCHWRSRTDTNPPNDGALAGDRNNNRANVKLTICEGTLEPCEDMASNLQIEYQNDCTEAVLTWLSPSGGGGGGVPGTITTSAANNGYGGVTVDITAGSQPVTITGIQTSFYTNGATVVYLYYRPGTACGFTQSSAGWTLIGQPTATITGAGYSNSTFIEFPTPVTIPAGQMYGFYFAAPANPGGLVNYTTGSTSTCGSSTIASNSHLTLKGGTGVVNFSGSNVFSGSINSERNFAGTIYYTTPGGKGKIAPAPQTVTLPEGYDPNSGISIAAWHMQQGTMPESPIMNSDGGVRSCPVTLPYFEGFEGLANWTMPACWERPTAFMFSSLGPVPGVYSTAYTGTRGLWIFSQTSYNYAVTPAISENIHTVKIEFAARREGAGSGQLTVGVMSDPTDPSTFEAVQALNAPADNVFHLYEVTFASTTLTGSNRCIAFRQDPANTYSYWIDDVNITSTGAPQSDYTYRVYRDGAPLGLVNTETYTDVTFDQYSGHEWEVRVVCDMGVESEGITEWKNKCNPTPCRPHIVGSGTTTSYQVPVNFYYSYSYTQQIYTQEEVDLEVGHTIYSVAFQYIKAAAEPKSNQTYYIGFTDKTAFNSTSDWIPLSQLTVASATKSITYNNANTWFVIEFDTPIEYPGGNIVIAVLNNDGDWTNSTVAWNLHAATGNKTLHAYTDSSPYNPAAPPTGNLLTNRANANFHICGFGDCAPPENLTATYDIFCTTATLTWECEDFGGKSAGKSMQSRPTPQYTTIPREGTVMVENGDGMSATTAQSALLDNTGVYTGAPYIMSDLSRGDYIYGVQSYYGMPQEHVRISVTNPGQGTTWSSFPILTLGGEYYDEYYYCSAENGNFYKVNHQTGAYTLLTNHGTFFNDLTYNYATGTMYGLRNQTTLYTINLSTGAATQVATLSNCGNGLITIACNLAGNMYGIEFNSSGAGLYSINVATGACTLIGPTGTYSSFAQGSTFDHETGIYYWCNYRGSGASNLFKMNLTTGAATAVNSNQIGEICGAYMPYVANQNIAKAPNPFTVTAVGTLLKANLAWTNPTQTLAGNPLTSIQKLVIKRDGTQVYEITSGITIGGSMTWTDNAVPSVGNHCYSIYAVTSEGNGSSASDCDLFGEVCQAEVVISYVQYGDMFSWTLKDDATGTILAGGGAQSPSGNNVTAGTFPAMLTGDATFNLWQHGTLYDNDVTLVINVNGNPVYSLTLVDIPAGYSTSAPIPCSVTPGVAFKIFRDGDPIEEYWTDLTYDDTDFDSFEPHVWKVVRICPDGFDSAPVTVALAKCSGECNPPENLEGEYAPDCSSITLTWEVPEPEGKKKLIGTIVETPGEDVAVTPAYSKPEALKRPLPIGDRNTRISFNASHSSSPQVPFKSIVIPNDRGEDTEAYAFDVAWVTKAMILPLNNPGGVTTFGSTNSTMFIGGDWVDGEWYAVADGEFSDPNIYKINPETGAVSVVAQHTVSDHVGGMAYHDGEGIAYVCTNLFAGSTFYKVNLTTGATTNAFTAQDYVICFCITNDGRFIGVDYWESRIVEINPTNGAFTTLVSLNFYPEYVQDMSLDRETNMVYWGAFDYGAWNSYLYKFDPATNQLTNLGVVTGSGFSDPMEVCAFAIPTNSDPTIAKKPDPFNVQTFGSYLAAKLTWTNPTETVGGEPLTNIIKMVVERNGIPIKEYPNDPVGASHTYMDTDIPTTGTYKYSVYAVTDAGDGLKASKTVSIGSFCDIIFEMWDSYGDGWDGSASVGISVDGVPYGTAKLSSGGHGFQTVTIPSGNLALVWNYGNSYDYEDSFVVYDYEGNPIYTSPSGMGGMGGVTFYSDYYECPFSMEYNYNVYMDGSLLGSTTETTWTQAPIPQYWDHTWCITVDCIGGGESVPTCITLEGCLGHCEPVENVQAEYTGVECDALITWDEPIPERDGISVLEGPRATTGNGSPKPGMVVSADRDPNPHPLVPDMFVPEPNNGFRGDIFFGNRTGWVSPEGHIKIPIANPTSASLQTPFSNSSALGGEFYDGYWYVSENAGSFPTYKVDHETGTYTTLTNNTGVGNFLNDMTYDYANNIMYALNNPNQIYSMDMNTGVCTLVSTIAGGPSSGFITIACNASGQMYGIELSGQGFYSINPTAGTCTLIGNTGITAMYAQSMTFDRETGILYWCAYVGSGVSYYTTVNVATGLATQMSSTYCGEICATYALYDPNPNIAAAPNPFTATAAGTFLICNLSWKNPTTTIGGDPLGAIDEIILMRGSTQIGSWNSVYPGQIMSFSDNVPSAGSYCYSVYAVTSEGNGQKASDCATLGDLCNLTVEMWDDFGDGWEGGSVTFKIDGITYGSASLAGGYGTTTVLVPSGSLDIIWNPGSNDCECEFAVYAPDGSLIYHSPANGSWPCGTPGVGMYGLFGSVYTTDFNCGNDVKVYRVYRDGIVVGPYVSETHYLDSGFDVYEGHTWCVTRICGEDERESPERCTYLRACGICYPIENLVITQPTEGEVKFCWTDPSDIPGFLGIKIVRDGVVIVPLVPLPNLCYTDYVSVGSHLYCFTAVYAKIECATSEAVCHAVDVVPQCDMVKNLTAVMTGPGKVTVSWMASNALGLIDYSVFCDGNPLGNTTQSFYIHEGVAPGEHIYSVVANYDKAPVCTESEVAYADPVWVETCVMITNLKLTEVTKTKMTLTWSAEADIETFAIYRDNTVIANVAELTYSDEGTFAEGVVYTYCVIPLYHHCQVAPECVEAYIEPCVPINVTNIAATGNKDAKTAYITWDYAGTDATFDILRDGKFLANTGNKNYTDNIEYDVIYKYCVKPVAECAGGTSACDTVLITPVRIIDPVTGLAIYPNPASTLVIIEGKDVVQVDIYNVVGQLIKTLKSVEGEFISNIDVSAYESGAYVFKIYTSDKAIVNTPIVIRH